MVPGTTQKRQRYIGEFVLDPDRPFDRMPALDADAALRTVIVFRLLPVQVVPEDLVRTVGFSEVAGLPRAFEVPTEIHSTEFFETADREGYKSIRRESRLVEDFIASQPGHLY